MQDITSTTGLINLIGESAFDDLCAVFGGTPIYLSQTEACFSRLSTIVGDDAARKIINAFPTETIQIPKADSRKNIKRNQAIGMDCAAGMTQRELAMKYGLTIRRIRMILNSPNRKT